MFDAHVPAKYRDRAPRVLTDENGFQQWWYGENEGRNLGLNAVAGKPREMYNVNPQRYDEMRPGCYDVHERVRDMSAGGQLAGLNFPNWTGFSGQVLNEGPDRDVNEIMIKAYNDWHVDEWCGAYPDRFIPCGILPLFDVRRRGRGGAPSRGQGLSRGDVLGEPSGASDAVDPLRRVGSAVRRVLRRGHRALPARRFVVAQLGDVATTRPPSVPMNLSSTMSIYSLGDLLWADFWWRFPELQVLVDRGRHRLDPVLPAAGRAHPAIATRAGPGTSSPTGQGPAEVFREHILCCFINDRVGVKLLDEFNLDNVCWESDYPHSDSSWPNAPEVLERAPRGATDADVNQITHENAMRHYQFDPFATRPPRAVHRRRAAGRGARRRHGHPRRPSTRRERRRLLPAPPGAASSAGADAQPRLRHRTLTVLDRKCLAPHAVRRWAAVTPDAVALEHVDGERLTYARARRRRATGRVRVGRARGRADDHVATMLAEHLRRAPGRCWGSRGCAPSRCR